MNPYRRLLAPILVVALAGCGSDGASAPTAAETTNEPTSAGTARDIWEIPEFAPLETGTYFIDPDNKPSTPLRVVYTIAADGWEQWFGAIKSAGDEHVIVSISTVTNLVRHGCRDHLGANPRVGPTVDDLATALADLAPFRVTSAPTDVAVYDYRGKHLELTLSKIDLAECVDGNLEGWISPLNGGAFYGYSGSGYTEEFWILDVEGSRLVVSTQRTPRMPAAVIDESRAILDSIRIEP